MYKLNNKGNTHSTFFKSRPKWFPSVWGKRNFKIKTLWRKFLEFWNITRILGVGSLIIGLAGIIEGPIPYLQIPGLMKLHQIISPELFGIGITVLIIDSANQRLLLQEEKNRLILQMGSPDHGFAIEAVRILRDKRWFEKGAAVNAHLSGADLHSANLSWLDLRGINLSYANLSNARLTGSTLTQGFFIKTNFTGADLRGVNMSKSILYGADLSEAHLSHAILREANLGLDPIAETYIHTRGMRGATLCRVKLDNTDLTDANLYRVDLTEADLFSAIFDNANLSGAILRGAKVTKEQLAKASNLSGTIMPDGSINGVDPGFSLIEKMTEEELRDLHDGDVDILIDHK